MHDVACMTSQPSRLPVMLISRRRKLSLKITFWFVMISFVRGRRGTVRIELSYPNMEHVTCAKSNHTADTTRSTAWHAHTHAHSKTSAVSVWTMVRTKHSDTCAIRVACMMQNSTEPCRAAEIHACAAMTRAQTTAPAAVVA